MIYEQVRRVPPEGGEAVDMLAMADCGARIASAITSAHGDMVFSVYCQAESARQITVTIGDESKTYTVGTGWQRIEMPVDGAEDVCVTAAGNTTVYLYKAQLETGVIPSEWKPAPEDTEGDISSAQGAAENAQDAAADAQTAADDAAKNAQSIADNLGKWFNFKDSRGLVIRAYDLVTGQPVGEWYTVTSETGYEIWSDRMTEPLMRAYKDRVSFTKAEIGGIVMKRSSKGGMVWVKG